MTIPQWAQAWLSPAGVLVVIGGIVWGIQLNIGYVMLAEKVAANTVSIKAISKSLEVTAINNATTSIILEAMREDIKHSSDHITKHDSESGVWKERIIKLEERNGGFKER